MARVGISARRWGSKPGIYFVGRGLCAGANGYKTVIVDSDTGMSMRSVKGAWSILLDVTCAIETGEDYVLLDCLLGMQRIRYLFGHHVDYPRETQVGILLLQWPFRLLLWKN